MGLPYFPFYPEDWLQDSRVTMGMDLAAEGAYHRLLCLMWTDKSGTCSVRDDNEWIAKGLRCTVREWKKIRKVLVDGPEPVIFSQDGRLVNKRLSEEWEKANTKSAKASDSAKKRHATDGANAPANAPANAGAIAGADGVSNGAANDGAREAANRLLSGDPRSQIPESRKGQGGRETGGASGRRRATASPLATQAAAPDESRAIDILHGIDGWPADEHADLRMLRDLGEEFPDVDVLEVARQFRMGKLDKPFKPNANPRSQFRTWVSHERQYAAERARASPSADTSAIDAFLAIGGGDP